MNNLIGALWMTIAMALYASVDSFVKLAGATLPLGQILVAVGLTGLAVFALAALARGLAPLPGAVFRGAALLRALFDAAASSTIIASLGHVDLSLFTAIIQANPLLVVLGAALFLGESVGWRRYIAIGTGLIGVLIVLRPSGDQFTPAALLVVLGVLFQAARDVTTRVVPRDIHSLQISAAAFAALAAVGAGILASQGDPPLWPEGPALLYLLGACGLSIPAVYAMIAAMRVGDVGFVAPFRYTRIVFGLALGVLVFRETLDAGMILGATIIVGSGLYAFWRETRLARRRPAAAPKGSP